MIATTLLGRKVQLPNNAQPWRDPEIGVIVSQYLSRDGQPVLLVEQKDGSLIERRASAVFVVDEVAKALGLSE